MERNAAWMSAAVIAAAVLTMGACSSSAVSSSSDLAGQQFAGYDLDEIVKAYSSEIEEYKQSLTTGLAREILEDGWVSDQELAEVQSKFKSCLTDAGVTGIKFFSDGSYTVEDYSAPDLEGMDSEKITEGEMMKDPVYRCSEETDEPVIEMAFGMMRTNPENMDTASLLLDCLKDKGAVDPGYTEEDLNRIYENADVDNSLLRSDDYSECLRDPMGLLPSDNEVVIQ